ncbi:NACHT domain- and WD repeat-containing protein 1 isoform X2 [Aphis craccivora]|uniref:NACHT domain-and WD repeat-containing protein 1 isoform X2 n=1 Tax=Aphis craccivora TaxID=307492 RepID=A0A6G0ZLR8_APHCR|nr:NACHT domain- and WD repeat-containing protein 1 isoform X2 [Aphis craccivora]
MRREQRVAADKFYGHITGGILPVIKSVIRRLALTNTLPDIVRTALNVAMSSFCLHSILLSISMIWIRRMNNEDEVQKVFRGELDTAKWAIPRLVKVFIASTRNVSQQWTTVAGRTGLAQYRQSWSANLSRTRISRRDRYDNDRDNDTTYDLPQNTISGIIISPMGKKNTFHNGLYTSVGFRFQCISSKMKRDRRGDDKINNNSCEQKIVEQRSVVVTVDRYFDGYVSGINGVGSDRSSAFEHSVSILECNNGIKRKHFCFVDTKSTNCGSEAEEKT